MGVAYLGSIVAANWAVRRFGVVPVWPGVRAPAAVYVVGVTLVLRDMLQERAGSWWVVVLMVAGAGLSAFVSPTLAVASGAAFLASESADFAVYTGMRRVGFLPAVLASNAVSLVVDSLVFLMLAFGSLTFLLGQIIGKAAATLVAVGVLWVLRRRREA